MLLQSDSCTPEAFCIECISKVKHECVVHFLGRSSHSMAWWESRMSVYSGTTLVNQLKPKIDEVGDIHFVLSREMVTSVWPIIALCIIRLVKTSRHSWPRILSCLGSVFYLDGRAKVCWDKGGMIKRLQQETFVGIMGDIHMLTIESLHHLHFSLSIWCFRNVHWVCLSLNPSMNNTTAWLQLQMIAFILDSGLHQHPWPKYKYGWYRLLHVLDSRHSYITVMMNEWMDINFESHHKDSLPTLIYETEYKDPCKQTGTTNNNVEETL